MEMELFDLVLLLAGLFLFGLQVGDFLGEKKAGKVFTKFQNRNYRLKDEMWKEIRRRRRVP